MNKIVYHGSQSNNLILEERPIYLTSNKEEAIEWAKGYGFNYDLLEEDKPTLYTIEVTLNNPKILQIEDDYYAYMEMTSQEWFIPELEKDGYDGCIYDTYYMPLNAKKQCKIIDKQEFPNNKVYFKNIYKESKMNIQKLNEELEKFIINEISDDTKASYLAKRQAQFDKAQKALNKAKTSIKRSDDRQVKALPTKIDKDTATKALKDLKYEMQKISSGSDWRLEDEDDYMSLQVRYWGQWEGDDGSGDYDWQELIPEYREDLDKILTKVQKKHGVQIQESGAEKNWLVFEIDYDYDAYLDKIRQKLQDFDDLKDKYVNKITNILEADGWNLVESEEVYGFDTEYTYEKYIESLEENVYCVFTQSDFYGIFFSVGSPKNEDWEEAQLSNFIELPSHPVLPEKMDYIQLDPRYDGPTAKDEWNQYVKFVKNTLATLKNPKLLK